MTAASVRPASHPPSREAPKSAQSGRSARLSAPPPRVRYVPGRRLGLLFLLSLPLFFVPGHGLTAGLSLDLLLLLATLYEARTLARAAPSAARSLEGRLLLGVDNRIAIRLHNRSAYRLNVAVRDDFPDSFHVAPDATELKVALPAHARRELSYDAVPSLRGQHPFGAIHVRIDGLLQLGAVIATIPAAQVARVYPNLRGPRHYELAARLGALRNVGVRNLRRSGGGGEFEQLREYVAGDSYRDVDWKATAKRLRPVTRVLGQERSQTVIVALDAGRMMATRLDRLTKLDHAINAALLLSYVALRSGDQVGLFVFAEDVLEFVPPRRGHSQYLRLLEALYAVEAGQSYVDFRRVLEFVRVRVPRRALVVLFSDLLDESQAEPMAEHARHLSQKHLPVCVTIDDPIAIRLADAEVSDELGVYRRAAAADLLSEREAIKAQLRKSGVGLVEASAGELALATVNRYLAIKNRGAL